MQRRREEEQQQQALEEEEEQEHLALPFEEFHQDFSSSQDQQFQSGLGGHQFGNQEQTYVEEQDEESEYAFADDALVFADPRMSAVDDLSTGSDSEYSNSKPLLV